MGPRGHAELADADPLWFVRRRLDVDAVMQGASHDAVFYVCGPVALIEAVLAAANRLGIEPGRVQYESFY